MEDGKKVYKSEPYHLISGYKGLGPSINIPTENVEGFYGYHYNSITSNVPATSLSSKESWKNGRGSNFPDGRKVGVFWTHMGGNLYEVWYRIYNASGTMISTGPTGYSTTFADSMSTTPLKVYAINNTKFIVVTGNIQSDFAAEYYRTSIVQENAAGEIQDAGGSIGNKNIISPSGAHTEPVQSNIDFDKTDLPIGFNLKDNIITSNKLDSFVRQQINSIRLNNIVILKKSGYISGSQNTGINIGGYSTNDVEMGSSVQFYSNGQNFQWYCYNPENLYVGTYSKVFSFGDKTLYVTVKVIQPPNNTGTTSVSF